MPYCTIEEAWENSLTQDELKPYRDNDYDLTLSGVDHEPYTKVKNMSRTYERLSEHSGPETRLKEIVQEQKEDSDGDSLFEISSVESEQSNLEKYKNEDSELKNLIKENKNLKKLIKKLKKTRENKNNSNKEFMLYIFSGLIVIMILENFRKIYRRF